MQVAVVTGAAGLIGAETARFFNGKGFQVVGIDNDMRKVFFGDGASTEWSRQELETNIPDYIHHDEDIRNRNEIEAIFATRFAMLKPIRLPMPGIPRSPPHPREI